MRKLIEFAVNRRGSPERMLKGCFVKGFCRGFVVAVAVGCLSFQGAYRRGRKHQRQKPAAPAQQSGMGTSTGGVFAAVHDSENRPITAGGFVRFRAGRLSGHLEAGRADRLAAQDGQPGEEVHSGDSRLRRRLARLRQRRLAGHLFRQWLDLRGPRRQRAAPPRPRSSTTIMTALLPMSPPKPE